jgi:HlyD family secretion protein
MPEQHRSLFRAEALKRFYSPEQLDQRINLIPPALRMMAAALSVIVVSGLVWAVLGVVPTRVTGQGVLLADGKAAHPVQPVVAGPLLELLVKRSDHVTVGAPIARVQQLSLETQVASTEARLAALSKDLAELKQAHAVEIAKIDATLRRQRAAAEEQIAAGKVRAEGLNDILNADINLFQRGLISRLELAEARASHDQTAQEIANAHARTVEIESLADQKRDDLAESERIKQEEINALQAEAARLRAELAIGSVVKAPVSGIIEEVRVGLGDVVSPGTPRSAALAPNPSRSSRCSATTWQSASRPAWTCTSARSACARRSTAPCAAAWRRSPSSASRRRSSTPSCATRSSRRP